MNEFKDTLDIPWIRRQSVRDLWLAEVTKDCMKLAHRHLRAVAEKHRGDRNGKLCSDDVKLAFGNRKEEIGAHKILKQQRKERNEQNKGESEAKSIP